MIKSHEHRVPFKRAYYRISLCILFFHLSFQQIILAQNPIAFTHYSINDGLPSNSINCTYVDKFGLLWVGTNSGLALYSGNSFTVFKNQPGDSGSICSNFVTSLCEDASGNIWIGTLSGLSRFIRKTNSFYSYFNIPGDSKSLPSNAVHALFRDHKNELWLGTSKGVARYNIGNDSFTSWLLTDNSKGNDIYFEVRSIAESKNGDLWFCTNGEGLEQLSLSKGKIIHHRVEGENFLDFMKKFAKRFIIDSNGEFWISASGSGLYSYNYDTKKVRKISAGLNPDNLSSNFVTGLIEFDSNTLWISTDGGGLNILDKRTFKVKSIKYEPGKTGGLTSSSIRFIGKTKDGNIWLGTINGGLLVFNRSLKIFRQYTAHYQIPQSLSHNAVSCIFQDRKKRIWVGTHGGGLNEFNIQNETFRRVPIRVGQGEEGILNIIFSIIDDEYGNIWLGTYGKGLIRYNPATGAVKSYVNIPGGNNCISDNNVYDIKRDHLGKYLLATYSGLNILDPEKEQFTCLNKKPDGPLQLWSVYEDSKNTIWIGTQYDGIYQYTRESDSFVKLNYNYSTLKGRLNAISNIFENPDGTVWITSTRDGIVNFENDRINENKLEDHLNSNIPLSILEDNQNNFWVGTRNGLIRFNYKNYKYRLFDRQDGIYQPDFLKGAASRLSTGEFAFGTTGGMLVFNPEEIKNDSTPAGLIFTNLFVNNNLVVPGKKTNRRIILPDALYALKEITLTPREKEFSIEFSTFHYASPQRATCYYKLTGVDSSWRKADQGLKQIKYTFLPAGDYVLQAKTITNDDIEGNMSTLVIHVMPPFWQKGWFIIICTLIVIVGINLWMRARTYWLRQRKIELEQIVKQRTNELEESAALLIEKQEEILQQKENLELQSDHLLDLNSELESQKEEIEKQNHELNYHKSNLEIQVKERTADLEKALKRAELSDRLKSSFLANLSHEIRTPMNAIIGFSSLLESSPDISQSSKEFIEIIQKNTEALLILIDDIIDISKIEADTIEIKSRLFSIGEVIADLYNTHKLIALNKGIRFKVKNEIKNSQVMIESDPIRIKQIISKLLSNAIKYTEKGEVLLGCSFNQDGGISISVKDTGIGIKAEKLSLIFKPFTKIEDNPEKLFRGAGLGLSIAFRLTEMLNLKFSADSTPGKGSVFTVIIPKEIVISNC